jgi:hypothetical protein
MQLAAELQTTLSMPISGGLSALTEDLPDRLIQEALSSTNSGSQRRRALPAEVVIWLVIGMSLLRERCIRAVLGHLNLSVGGSTTVTSSAIVQARDRLGEEAMATLFGYTAKQWALSSANERHYHGLAVFGLDGSTLRVHDSLENEVYFGRPKAAKGRGQSGYPQARIVALMALRSHLLFGAAIGPYRTGEQTLAKQLWPLLPLESLVMMDRGFIDYSLFADIMQSGDAHHFLCRAKKNLKWTVLRVLGPGDTLVQIEIPHKARKARPELPEAIVVRAIQYQRQGFQPQMLLTSLIDAASYPAEEIAELYHERWELELGYDEIKTHTLEREETLRSKSPERVRQELWGLFIAYNLVRRQIEKFATAHAIHPLRVSFRATLLLVRNTCICAASGVGSVRKLIDEMNAQMALLVLPERRQRRYARTVKIKMSKYKRNSKRGSARLI